MEAAAADMETVEDMVVDMEAAAVDMEAAEATVVDREAMALAAAVVAVIKQHPTTGSSSEDGEHVTRGRRRVDFTGSRRKTWPVSQVVMPHSLSFGLRE